MNEIEFEEMTIAVIGRISKKMLEDFAQTADVRLIKHWIEDEMMVRITQKVFGRQILHEEISYPANWKEAFKERWYPTWAKDKWPVRYATKTFDVRELVPSLNIPGHKPFINVEVT